MTYSEAFKQACFKANQLHPNGCLNDSDVRNGWVRSPFQGGNGFIYLVSGPIEKYTHLCRGFISNDGSNRGHEACRRCNLKDKSIDL